MVKHGKIDEKYYYKGTEVNIVNGLFGVRTLKTWDNLQLVGLDADDAYRQFASMQNGKRRLIYEKNYSRDFGSLWIKCWYTYNSDIDDVEWNGFICANNISKDKFEFVADDLKKYVADKVDWLELLNSTLDKANAGRSRVHCSELFENEFLRKMSQLEKRKKRLGIVD